jgi:HAD superfamily hydrolase (TIGR01509 family)
VTATAVLFDLDGLLIDSEPVWYEVESAYVTSLGGTWGPQHQQACIGGTIDATCRYIAELTGSRTPVAEMQEALVDAMVDRFDAGLPVHDGALELVDAVRARGVPTAVVTSSYRALLDAALRQLGRDRFDAAVSGDEVARGKPDAEPYLSACAALGVAASRCVVLEDAMTGVRSAEAAGCAVVVVPSVAPIDPAPCRHVVGALRDIDPDWLLALA